VFVAVAVFCDTGAASSRPRSIPTVPDSVAFGETMPPRFAPLQVPSEEPQQYDSMNRSVAANDNGGMNILTKSLNTYEFCEDGMTRGATPTSDGQSFKVSEKDLNIVKTLGRGASSVVGGRPRVCACGCVFCVYCECVCVCVVVCACVCGGWVLVLVWMCLLTKARTLYVLNSAVW